MKITREPDPELVKCSGLGLESPRLGMANSVQVKIIRQPPGGDWTTKNNTFKVDCDNAGSSFLFAAILGPNNRQGQVPKYSVCSLAQSKDMGVLKY